MMEKQECSVIVSIMSQSGFSVLWMVISQLGQSSSSASAGGGGWGSGFYCIIGGRTTTVRRKRESWNYKNKKANGRGWCGEGSL